MPGCIVCRKCGRSIRSCHCKGARTFALKIHGRWLGGFRSLLEVQTAQTKHALHPLHSAGLGPFGSPRLRFDEYVGRWIEERDLRPKTQDTYRFTLRRYVKPTLGHLPLHKIGPLLIDDLLARLKARGLSSSTVSQVFRFLHAVFADVVRRELVLSNPCNKVNRPRIEYVERHLWDLEQTRLFLAEARRSSRFRALYLLLATTGVRIGEALALEWDDVDFVLGAASITKTLCRIGRQVIVGPVKTRAGRRQIPLPAPVLDALRVQRAGSTSQRVFDMPSGRPPHPTSVYDDLAKVAKRAGVPRMRVHDLRHLAATLMFASGAHPKTVSTLLGHSSIGITTDLYGHLMPGMAEAAVEAVATRLLPFEALRPDRIPASDAGGRPVGG